MIQIGTQNNEKSKSIGQIETKKMNPRLIL